MLDAISLVVGALVIVGFVAILVAAPTTAPPPDPSPPPADAAPSGSSAADEQPTEVAARPDCDEVSSTADPVTCQQGERVLTIGRAEQPLWVQGLGVTVTRIRVARRGDTGGRLVRVTLFAATRSTRPRFLERSQFGLGAGQARYTPRSVRPRRRVPRSSSRSYVVTFAVPAATARRALKTGDAGRLVFAPFGARAETSKRLGVIRFTVPDLQR